MQRITGTLAARDGVAIEMIRPKLRDLCGKDGKTYYNRKGYFALICTSFLWRKLCSFINAILRNFPIPDACHRVRKTHRRWAKSPTTEANSLQQ
jgi:hypothetical protein